MSGDSSDQPYARLPDKDEIDIPSQSGVAAVEERKVVNGAQFIITSYKETGAGPLPVPELPKLNLRPAVASPLASVTTLCNTAVGAGVLSLPFAFRMAGLGGGLLLCFIMCILEGFTLYILSKFSERYQRATYAQLLRATLGKKLSAALPIIMNLYAFGSCSAYMIILGDYFSFWAQDAFGEDTRFTDRTTMILITGFGAMLPLCLAKRLNALATFSSVAIFGFFFISFVVMKEGYAGWQERQPYAFEDIVWFKWDNDFLYAIPIVSFGFNCHVNAIPVFQELTDKPSNLIGIPKHGRRGNKSAKLVNMMSVAVVSMLVVLVGYIGVGVAGYCGYPHVTPNMFNSLPQTAILQAAKVVVSFIVVINYPLTHFPSRECGLEFIAMCGFQSASESTVVFTLFTVVWVTGTIVVGILVHDLGLVLNIIGGTGASFIVFFNPGLMMINDAIKKDCTSKLDSLCNSLTNSLVNSRVNSGINLAAMADGLPPPASADAHAREAAPLLRDFPSLSSLSPEALKEPLSLHMGSRKGIKKTGIVYSPGRQWAVGMFLLSVGVFMAGLTVYTAVLR